MSSLYTRTEDVLDMAQQYCGVYVPMNKHTGRPLCGCGKTRYDFRLEPYCHTKARFSFDGCNLTQPDFHCDGHYPFNRFTWRARELYAVAFMKALAVTDDVTIDEMRCAIDAFAPTLIPESVPLLRDTLLLWYATEAD